MRIFTRSMPSISMLATLSAASTMAASKPNIVFILADDWGRGDIKAYGGDMCKIDTPNMDRLAAKGMMFTDAHTTSSVCTPSRYGLLTGRYDFRSPLKRGVNIGFSPSIIESGRETVAALLKKNGYTTGCIGKWHLGMTMPTKDGKAAYSHIRRLSDSLSKCNVDWSGKIKNGPIDFGFDYYWGISASLDMPPYIWINNDHFVGDCSKVKAFFRPGPANDDFEAVDVLPTLAEKAVSFIDQNANKGKPFFLYLPLNSPHTPHVPSKQFRGKSKVGVYGDFVMETDWAIGKVINAIEQAGIADNTLLIVSADNGCSPACVTKDKIKNIRFLQGSDGPIDPNCHYPSLHCRGNKADIYDGGHRVPFIARWDGIIKAGSKCDATICLSDFFATCADIIGSKYPPNAAEDSVSFLPLLTGKSSSTRRVAIMHHSINGSMAIRQGDWKLEFCPGSGGWSSPRPRTLARKPAEINAWLQLYNLKTDPSETKNVAAEHPEIVKRLTALANKYIKDGRSTPGKPQKNTGATYLYPRWIRKAHPLD